MDDDVVGLEPYRQAGPVAKQGVGERGGDVHVGDGIAELVGLGLLQLDRPFADDRSLVPAAAGRLELLEDPRQQLGLEQPIGLGRHLVALCVPLQSLLFRQLFEVVLDLLLELAQLVNVARARRTGPAPPDR